MAAKGKQVFLIRHGDTGLARRYIGASDVPVSEKGRQQLRLLAPKITGISFDLVLVSPLLRCLQSLEILGLSGEIEPLLKEVDFGRWEGKNFAEVSQQEPELVRNWMENKAFSFPGGESLVSFQDRINQIATRLYNEKGQRFLILAHGGVLRLLLCNLLNLSAENYLLFDVAPGKISEILLYPEGGILRRFNCMEAGDG